MPDPAGDGTDALAARLVGIRRACPGSDPDMVAEVVRAVLDTRPGVAPAANPSLLGEVEALGRMIAAVRAEIAALQADDISASHIPSATDELDAIVAHTAGATDSILEVCEMLDRIAATQDGAAATALQEATTRIYEACGFQDITGQRITRVVATLKTIDAKVTQIIHTFAPGTAMPASPAAPTLLHGPQLPANAMHQSDVDALLAGFD